MDLLPFEAFICVISQLPTKDKLNCIRVSKKWHQLIKSSVLYTELKITSQANLDEALSYFCRFAEAGKTVSKLEIQNGGGSNLHVEHIDMLPQLFPNLRHFVNGVFGIKLKERAISDLSPTTFSSWNRLKSLEDYVSEHTLANAILQFGKYEHLTQLSVRCLDLPQYQPDLEIVSPPSFKALMRFVKNAPVLESFSAHNGLIDLSDLETLHTNAPNLQEVDLKEFQFDNKSVELDIVQKPITPASHMRKFKLMQSFSNEMYIEDPSRKSSFLFLLRWFAYFASKYGSLEEFFIEPVGFYGGSCMPSIMVKPFRLLFTAMPHLKKFGINKYLLTSDMLQAMYDSGIRLSALDIWVWSDKDADRQFKAVQNSPEAPFIEELAIKNPEYNDDFYPPELLDNVIDLCKDLPRLKKLTINDKGDCGMFLFNALLKKVPTIETLVFQTMIFGFFRRQEGNPDADEMYMVRNTGHLKHLDVKIANVLSAYHSIKQINSIFKFALDSSPELETFKLGGSMDGVRKAEIRLDFTSNINLKSIDITFYKFAFCICNKAHPNIPPEETDNCVMHIKCHDKVKLNLVRDTKMDYDLL